MENLTCPRAIVYAADDLTELPDIWETAIPAGCWFQPGGGRAVRARSLYTN